RLRYILENQDFFDRFIAEGWYNRTSLEGNAQHPSKRMQIPQLTFPLMFTGHTDIDLTSTGARTAVTWGKEKEIQLSLGADFRYLNNELNEIDALFNVPCPFNFGIPRSHHSTTGIFAENVTPYSESFQVKLGARADWVNTNIDQFPMGGVNVSMQDCT